MLAREFWNMGIYVSFVIIKILYCSKFKKPNLLLYWHYISAIGWPALKISASIIDKPLSVDSLSNDTFYCRLSM